MEKNEGFNDINTKISLIIAKCNDANVYSLIMQDLYINGLFNPSSVINSFNYLPILQEKQLRNNFYKNINKIISYIKTTTNYPELDIYKVLSCIYGAFLGDAMGAFCEFEQPNKNNSKRIFKYPNTVIGGVPGQVTDDSEMSLSLAYAIMDNPMKEELLVDYIYFYYGAWFKTNPLDYGNTTEQALKPFDFIKFNPNAYNFNSIETSILQNNFNSLSNGFLMRKSPFIAWLYYRFYYEINEIFSDIDNNKGLLKLYKKIKNLSYPDNKCTNPSEQANAVSAVYCLMALMAIKGLTANVIIHYTCNLCGDSEFKNNSNDEKFVAEIILYYINLFNSKNFEFNKVFGNLKSQECVFHKMGYYLHALKLTLYFLFQFDYIEQNQPEKKFREIMNQICDLGGDTDTNCCIVGGVLGPLIGMYNFGKEFNKMVELIPPNREIYSASLALLFVIYLKKSNRNDKLVENNKYFLQQILTMLYGDIELDY